jgi:hypothetical protein
MSKVQTAVIANGAQSPFIIQRNPGHVRNDRVARPTFPGELGKRYEVLEKAGEWSLITVLTVIEGGNKR